MDPQVTQGQQPGAAPTVPGERVVSEQDKALAKDWLKRIETALGRPDIKREHEAFKKRRELLRGKDGEKRLRVNLFYSELAAMRPALYAKDPEYAIQPTPGVPQGMVEVVRQFGRTCEAVLGRVLVKDAKLKRRAKRIVTSAFGTSVGWWKLCWQEDKRTDPLIQNEIADTQDNLMRLQRLREQVQDPEAGANTDLQIAQLQQTLQGLQTQAEVTYSKGLTLDDVLPEDIVILDPSIRNLADYERAGAIAHRVWMTREQYRQRFGAEPSKGKTYREKGTGTPTADAGNATNDRRDDLFAVWEIWEKDSNRVFHVCEGEEGFCDQPSSPDWTGERWYPFFALIFNEADGELYPLSDVELIAESVRQFNSIEHDFEKDRRDARPFTVVRKGGALTDADISNVRNRDGNDVVLVEGNNTSPIGNDIQTLNLGAQMKPEVYDTTRARANIEQLLGGGDAARGTVMEAKTATEAKIVAQGLQGRSGERRDTLEDLLTELGVYALQICMRKLTVQDVQEIAGEDAQWPQATSPEIVFKQINIEVRGGSTGKPDQAQEQETWTKLMPVIKDTAMQVAELRAKGESGLADALVQLLRETLRRFDERLDLDQFLPPAKKDGQPDAGALQAENTMMKAKGEELLAELQKLRTIVDKGFIQAATSIATSAAPGMALQAFAAALKTVEAIENDEETPGDGAQYPGEPNEPPEAPEGAQPTNPPPDLHHVPPQAAQPHSPLPPV